MMKRVRNLTAAVALLLLVGGCTQPSNSTVQPTLRIADGHIEGNGGDVVICRLEDGNETIEMLDVFEAKKKGYRLHVEGNSVEKGLEFVVSRISKQERGRGLMIEGEAKEFLATASFIEEGTLPDVPDTGTTVIPANCHLEQIAVFTWNPPPGEPIFTVRNDLYKKLDVLNRTALSTHEILYRYGLSIGHRDSQRIRRYNGFLLSKEAGDIPFREYIALLGGLGFPHFFPHNFPVAINSIRWRPECERCMEASLGYGEFHFGKEYFKLGQGKPFTRYIFPFTGATYNSECLEAWTTDGSWFSIHVTMDTLGHRFDFHNQDTHAIACYDDKGVLRRTDMALVDLKDPDEYKIQEQAVELRAPNFNEKGKLWSSIITTPSSMLRLLGVDGKTRWYYASREIECRFEFDERMNLTASKGNGMPTCEMPESIWPKGGK